MCKRPCSSFFEPFLVSEGESVASLADEFGVEVQGLFDQPKSRKVRVGRPPKGR